MLKCENINVFYGDLHILWDISLNVASGETVAIIGSNGAGKTTLLKTIIGLMHPRTGVIKFLGKPIHNLATHKIIEMGIALVPEGRGIFPQMTVEDNLFLGAYTKYARKKLNDTIEWVYTLFPILKKRKNQLAGTLSGGEQQMLAIGRGLMSRPKLLMLDEPSMGLAPKLVLEIFKLLKKMKEEVTILLVEQNVHHSLKLADKAYVIETGKIKLSGTGDELLNNTLIKKTYLGM